MPMILWIIGWVLTGLGDPFAGNNWATLISYISSIIIFLICFVSMFTKSRPLSMSLLLAIWPIGVYLSFIFWFFMHYQVFLMIYSLLFMALLIPYNRKLKGLNCA